MAKTLAKVVGRFVFSLCIGQEASRALLSLLSRLTMAARNRPANAKLYAVRREVGGYALAGPILNQMKSSAQRKYSTQQQNILLICNKDSRTPNEGLSIQKL